jgi:DNA-binding CsgD family transcriptional regulator
MNYLEKFISHWPKNNGINSENSLNQLIENLKKEKSFKFSQVAHFLYDYQNKEFKFFSDKVKQVLGYDSDELTTGGIDFYHELMHPEDANVYTVFSLDRFDKYLKTCPEENINILKFGFNYRLRKKDKKYLNLLQEFLILKLNEHKTPVYCFGHITEITNPKNKSKISFRVSKYDKNEGFVEELNEYYPGHILTKKEIEILSLAKRGLNSSEIAENNFNALDTIKTHRKNILRKLNFNKFQKAINHCT